VATGLSRTDGSAKAASCSVGCHGLVPTACAIGYRCGASGALHSVRSRNGPHGPCDPAPGSIEVEYACEPQALTPLRFLERSARVFPEKLAIVCGGRRFTYREFAEEATRIARALQARGGLHLRRDNRLGGDRCTRRAPAISLIGRGATRRLHVCPRYGSECVNPAWTLPVDDDTWAITLRCGACADRRDAVISNAERQPASIETSAADGTPSLVRSRHSNGSG
jgi:non-ribosomal peptide synthetase component F